MSVIIELDVEVPDLASIEVETPDSEITPSGGETVLLVATPGPPGPPGPPGEGTHVIGEPLTGTRDGVNAVFTTAQPYRGGTTAVYLNGLREHHYTENPPDTIVFEDAPTGLDHLACDYTVE